MDDRTMTEVRDAKERAERDIAAILDELGAFTGMPIEDVTWRPIVRTVGGPVRGLVEIDLRVP